MLLAPHAAAIYNSAAQLTFWESPPTWPLKYVVVSGVRRMKEVNARTSGPVSTGMGDRFRVGKPSRYVTSQLGQLSHAFLQGRLVEYRLRLGVKAGMPPLPGDR